MRAVSACLTACLSVILASSGVAEKTSRHPYDGFVKTYAHRYRYPIYVSKKDENFFGGSQGDAAMFDNLPSRMDWSTLVRMMKFGKRFDYPSQAKRYNLQDMQDAQKLFLEEGKDNQNFDLELLGKLMEAGKRSDGVIDLNLDMLKKLYQDHNGEKMSREISPSAIYEEDKNRGQKEEKKQAREKRSADWSEVFGIDRKKRSTNKNKRALDWSEVFGIDRKKRSFDWDDYFGYDKRNQSPQKFDEWLANQYINNMERILHLDKAYEESGTGDLPYSPPGYGPF